MDKKLDKAQAQLGKTYDALLASTPGSVKKAIAIHKVIEAKMPTNAKSLMQAIESAKKRIPRKDW